MTGAAATTFPTFATAPATERAQLVVSLHDVAPPTWEAAENILRDLGRCGVRVCSLLVVPDYHHTGNSMADPKFVRWLRTLEEAGHEIVIHGYFHERPSKDDEPLRQRLLTQSYTAGEGEFYDLAYEEARGRIQRARAEFMAAGLTPRGFIAPAWLLSADGERAAAEAEMEYTTRLTTIVDLRSAETYRARSLVYSVRSAWRRTASLAWNAAQAQIQSTHPLLRLGIHPPDITHPDIWAQILRLTETFATQRHPTTYRDWVAARRSET